MLPQWDPDRLQQKIPFNLALIGGRRQGKSTAVSDLVMRMRSRFDLIVAFIGSAACNPVIHHIMSESFDPRFFYSEWNQPLVSALLRQQEMLGADKRSILILMDDVILSGKSEDQLNHMAMRGRHFGVSLIMCAVSYTTLPKKTRRSLDALIVFSLPMQGDMKLMTWEYASRNSMAEHVLRNLGDHEALVLETLQKQQQLFMWKADLLTLEGGNNQSASSPESGLSKTEPSSETPRVRRTEPRRKDTSGSRDRKQSAEGPVLRTHTV